MPCNVWFHWTSPSTILHVWGTCNIGFDIGCWNEIIGLLLLSPPKNPLRNTPRSPYHEALFIATCNLQLDFFLWCRDMELLMACNTQFLLLEKYAVWWMIFVCPSEDGLYHNVALFIKFPAIDEASTENGCLTVYPGSYQWGYLEHGYPDWEYPVNKLYHGIKSFQPSTTRAQM